MGRKALPGGGFFVPTAYKVDKSQSITKIYGYKNIVFSIIRKKQEKKEKKASAIQEANIFLEGVKKNKALPTVYSSLMLEAGEKAFLEENSVLAEPRAVRRSTGSGAGFRVMKGVYVGGYSGRSESSQEWRMLDEGTLTLTNNRVIFRGSKENKTIPLDKIISISNSMGTVEVSLDGKSKPTAFKVNNSYIWAATIHIAKAAENPLQLGDMKIDIEFK